MPISFFSRLFGNKNSKKQFKDIEGGEHEAPPKVEPLSISSSVDKLASQQDFLSRRIALLERQIGDQRVLLKSHIEKGGDKTRAKSILSEIKKKETEITKLTSQLLNLEAIEKALTDARIQKEITNALQGATKTLKHERINVEEAEKIMDDAQDLIDSQQESSEILSRRFVTNTTYQEDEEIEAELNSLFDSAESHNVKIKIPPFSVVTHSAVNNVPSPQESSSSEEEKKKESERLLSLLEC